MLILVCLGVASWARGQDATPGLVKEKPTSGRFVETPLGYMVPYEATIPGSDVTYRMQPIPGGKVMAGSPVGEKGRQKDEGPQFEVIVEPFWMAEHEVTWAEYKTYMSIHDKLLELYTKKLLEPADPKHEWMVTAPSNLYEPSFTYKKGDGPTLPAASMTQFSAKQYTKWLSGISGQFFRLPSEAEWEYACRAGATTAFHFGDDASKLGEYGWYYDNSGEMLNPVAKKKPNAWGLHDMHGNVGEWVLDQYIADGYKAHAGKTVTAAAAIAWPTKLYPRVSKGGGWDDDALRCRVASRQADDEEWRKTDPNLPRGIWWYTEEISLGVGFRFIRPLSAPTTIAEKNRFWNADVADITDVMNLRIDNEGRGARGIANKDLPAALKKLESPQK
jgi:sulfatase modifying factor 1